MADIFVDFIGGNNANSGADFANRKLNISSGVTGGLTNPGDDVWVMKTPSPLRLQTAAGVDINATFTDQNQAVVLSAAATAAIYSDGAWTAKTNVTCTASGNCKEGASSSSSAIASGFTTGLASFYAFSATNFSAYGKISFWIRTSTAQASGKFALKLCSDALGVTAVNTFTINEALAANVWRCITIDNAGALGSSIQSIGLYCITDPGTTTVLIDNVIACNRLTLTSVIGKSNSELSYEWHPIQSISGVNVLLDTYPNNANGVTNGYTGTTETVAIYSREPARVFAAQNPNANGTAGNVTTYHGGMDETNMTSQTSLTILDFGDGNINALNAGGTMDFTKMENILFVRANIGLSNASTNKHLKFKNIGFIGCVRGMFPADEATYPPIDGLFIDNVYFIDNALSPRINGSSGIIKNVTALGTRADGVMVGNSNVDISNVFSRNNNGDGLSIWRHGRGTIRSIECKDNGDVGIGCYGGSAILQNLITSGNLLYGVWAGQGGSLDIDGADCTDGTPFFVDAGSNGRINISRFQGDPTDERVYGDNGALLIQRNNTIEHTAGEGSWQHTPISSFDEDLPLAQYTGFATVEPGSQTHSFWVRRSDLGGVASVTFQGGQIEGEDVDIVVTHSDPVDTWQKLSITINPTATGPIRFLFSTYGDGDMYFADYEKS